MATRLPPLAETHRLSEAPGDDASGEGARTRRALSSGQRVGEQFRIVEALGEGGFGQVYLAVDEILDRRVALKVVKTDSPADMQARFAREARLHADLRHPSFARLLTVGRTPDIGLWIVQELVEGRTLADRIRDGGPLEGDAAARLAIAILDGLEEAHRSGIVHRDIKPENLMLLPDDAQVRILDLGIARHMDGDRTAITAPRAVVGSPHFMSPEQAHGDPPAPSMDVYSVACVLFYMLSGRPPYAGSSALSVVLAHIQSPLPELPDRVPAALAEIVRIGLAKSPADRFPSARAMAEALEAALVAPIVGAGAGPGGPVRAPSPSTMPPPGAFEPASGGDIRRRGWARTAGTLALLVTGGWLGGAWMTSPGAPSMQPSSAPPGPPPAAASSGAAATRERPLASEPSSPSAGGQPTLAASLDRSAPPAPEPVRRAPTLAPAPARSAPTPAPAPTPAGPVTVGDRSAGPDRGRAAADGRRRAGVDTRTRADAARPTATPGAPAPAASPVRGRAYRALVARELRARLDACDCVGLDDRIRALKPADAELSSAWRIRCGAGGLCARRAPVE